MAVIGLTGNIGSGKTTVCQLLAARGCLCLNADLLGRSVSEPGGEAYEQLRQSFGAEFFSPDGWLLRPRMADLVFNDKEQLARLNGIIHPAVRRVLCQKIAAVQAEEPQRVIVVEAALLVEADYLSILNQLWLVWADDDVRLKRVMSRDKLDRQQALARMNNQMPQAQKAKDARYIVHNNNGRGELEQELAQVWQQFCQDFPSIMMEQAGPA